jgi:hypothetical protein
MRFAVWWFQILLAERNHCGHRNGREEVGLQDGEPYREWCAEYRFGLRWEIDGNFFALNASNGKCLWKVGLGGTIAGRSIA